MKTTKITDVVMKEDKRDNPVLLNFQNAEMSYKNDSEIQCFRAEDVNRAALGDNCDANPSRMAVVISGQQAYRGYLGEGLPAKLMDTYVAIRNKKTGKMRLIQLEECNMLNACYDDNKNKFQQQKESLQTMMRKFGGKVANRALDRNERSISNIDVMNESIQQTVRGYDEEQFAEDNAFTKVKVEGELILASIKPPRNPNAKTPAELYLLEDMLSESVLNSLKTAALGLMQKDPETIELSNVYLTNKLKTALQSKEPDSDDNVRALQICLYMDALSLLLQSNATNFDKMWLSGYSKELFYEMKQKFSEVHHHTPLKTKYSNHKALTHYVAMAFVLDNGVLNVDQLHGGLNINKNELLKFAAFIGGSYNSAKNALTLRMTAGETRNDRSFGGWRRAGRKNK